MGLTACVETESPEGAVIADDADERAAQLWDSIDGYEDWAVVPTDERVRIHALERDEGSSLYVVEPLDVDAPTLTVIERDADDVVVWAEFSPTGEFVYAVDQIDGMSDAAFRLRRKSDYACVGCHQEETESVGGPGAPEPRARSVLRAR